MGSRFTIPTLAMFATLMAIPAARAADMPLPPPPAEPCCSAWYLRGDIGFSNQNVGSLLNDIDSTYDSVVTVNKGFDAAPFYGLGIGYAFNNWLRFDVTGEYRGSANFHGMQIGTVGGVVFPDNYSASKSEWTFLTNGYVDLGTWNCITPFIGAGIGVSRNTISNFTDVSNCVGGCGNPGTNAYFDAASKWSFAWALYGGLAYQVSPNVTVELSYRYLDLGNGTTGTGHSFDNSLTYTPFEFHNLTSNDVKLGLRFNCCEVPPSPPLLHSKG